MKPTFTICKRVSLILIMATLFVTQFSCKRQEKEEKENLMVELRDRDAQEFQRRVDPALGKVPIERLRAAQAYVNRNFSQQQNTAVNGISWVERGPNNIGGRTRSLVWDKNDATNKAVFAGSVGGGIWKCTDVTAATPTWTKVTDIMDNIAIDWMIQDQITPNIMYAGTGEGWNNADGINGYGIFKSTDGGATWAHLPATSAPQFNDISRIVINPAHEVFAATDGDISKSTDGGLTWTSVLPNGHMADVALAVNGDLYAADYAGRIYKSPAASDGAVGSWTLTTYAGVTGADRTVIATAPSDANTVYAVTDGGFGAASAMYKSVNAGVTWTPCTLPPINGHTPDWTNGQGWYDLWLTVDPTTSTTFMAGAIDVCRSTDGGTTWTVLGGGYGGGIWALHPDQHIGVYRPGSTTQAVFGCDGGVYYSSNILATAQAINTNYNVTQFYSGAISPVAGSNYLLGGAQDNQSLKLNTAGIGAGTAVSGGDGAICHISPLANGATQFSSYVYCSFYKSTNSGATFAQIINQATRGQFICPTAFDSANSYMFGDYTDRTTPATPVGGQYFKWLTTGATITACTVTNFAASQINSIIVSPNDADRIYCGLINGSVVYVDAASAAPVAKTGVILKPAGAGVVSGIAVQQGVGGDNHVLVTYSSYGVGHIYETTNAGATWTNISGNFPDIPVNWVIFYPGSTTQALIATDLGVWSTNLLNGVNTEWSPTNFGALGNVRTEMLKVRYADNTIVASTHGRGLFTTTLANAPLPQVFFRDPLITVNEHSAGTTSGCTLGTTTVPVNVMITGAPAAGVTVTVTATSRSTAINGVDYTIGSGTATFTNAAYGPQVVNVTINDNDRVDGDRYIQLNYAITSGGANAVASPTNQDCEILIKDDEVAPNIAYTKDVYSGPSTASLGPSAPLAYNAEAAKKNEVIYRMTDLVAQGIDPTKPITRIGLNVTAKTSTIPYTGYTVTIGTTALTTLGTAGTAFAPVTAPVTIFSGTFTPVIGINYFNIAGGYTLPTIASGQNLIVTFCFSNTATNTGTGDACDGTLTADTTQLRYISATPSFNACGQGTFNAERTYQPRLIFSQFIPQTVIETALNSTNSNILNYNNGTVYYFNPSDGKIMAGITQTDLTNYGCTSVTIDRAGTSASPFWYASPVSTFVTDKTFHVIPATNNPTGTYTITLYYSAGEKAGWEAATGNSWNNIMMIKTQNAISTVTPATPGAGGTVQVVTPIRATFGTDYTLSYTFNTGFSGFTAGIPGANPTPVTLLSFGAQRQNHSALLQWSTSQEINSKVFDVQRSVDGINFITIGKVNAAGNSSTVRRYSFIDPSIRAMNYYRLQLENLDASSTLSNVVNIRADNLDQTLYVVNPFGSYIDIQFAKIPTTPVQLRLLDISGKQLSSGTYNNVNYNLRFNNVNMVLSKGIYIMEARVDGQIFTYKLVKQ